MAEYFENENELKLPTICTSQLVCPLCNSKRKSFSCENCVKNGNFSHSRGKYSERYNEASRKLEILKRLKKEYEKRALNILKQTEEAEKLNCEIISRRQKVLLLRLVVEEAVQNLKSEKDVVDELQRCNQLVKSKQTDLSNSVQVKAKQMLQCQVVVEKSKKDLEAVMEKLCEVRRRRISQIQKYLFPIQVNPIYQVLGTPLVKDNVVKKVQDIQCDVESDDDDESRESQLAEATRTSYIEGRWVSEEEDLRMQCSINDTCLPANADYTAYHEWVKAHRNGSRGPSDEEVFVRNPAFMVTAALTHACQMVELLAVYLDVNLPKRINYSEFCQLELSKRDFRSAVDRLNSNVLHLCFTQHVEPSLLHSRRILHNLYTCVNSLHLGRGGPFECHPKLVTVSYESSDSDSSDKTDVGSEDANSESDAEWENLPANLVHITEASAPPGPLKGSLSQSSSLGDGQKLQEPATASSLVSSAAASVAALWPWKK
ncbi:autophagy protein 14 [Porites harrisoni]